MANETAPTVLPVVKPGTKINLVHAKGHHVPAKVTKVLNGNKVDLEADLGEETPLVITSSPYDPTGKKPDSWHVPASDTPPAK